MPKKTDDEELADDLDDDLDDDLNLDEETEAESDDDDDDDNDDIVELDSAPADEPVASPAFQRGVHNLTADVPVQVVAVLGKRSISMQDLMAFHMGQVIELYRPANEMVDLVANGKMIAKGELVSIDGKLGVKIVKLIA